MDLFKDIAYLRCGAPRQRKAAAVLDNLGIMHSLLPYDPILAGTIPLGIDIESSDLDIICRVGDLNGFAGLLETEYGGMEGFTVTVQSGNIIASFLYGGFDIEVFGEDKPTTEQNAYRHMLTEAYILAERDTDFRDRIISLKRQGIKTEPAFALVLGLEGDPYEAVLEYGRRKGLY